MAFAALRLPRGTALVTGAGSGIGRAIAYAYARSGVANLYIADLNSNALEETIAECKTVATDKDFRVEWDEVDVRSEAAVTRMVDRAVEKFGRLDYAANVAGIGDIPKPTASFTAEEFNRTVDVNVKGVFYCMREELRAMLKNTPESAVEGRPVTRGSIINMGSIASQIVIPGQAAYVTSKYAVTGMTKAAAHSHGADHIRVNSINPGYILTPLFKKTYPDLTPFEQLTAVKRMGLPEEIADLAMYLSSPLSSFMTGSTITIDGGSSLT